jgi:hypothetical protein
VALRLRALWAPK